MSEKSSRGGTARFCPSCGERAVAGAKFCMACGSKLGPGAPGSGVADGERTQTFGLVVFGGFLAVGLALWFAILQPQSSGRLPLAQQAPPQPGAAEASTGLPENHPPLEVPAEVKTFMAEL